MLQLLHSAFRISSTCADICSIFTETWIWFYLFVDRSIASCALAEMSLKGKQCVQPFSTTLISSSMCINIIYVPLWNRISSLPSTRQLKKQIGKRDTFDFCLSACPSPASFALSQQSISDVGCPFRLPFFPLFSLLTGDVGRCHLVSYLFFWFLLVSDFRWKGTSTSDFSSILSIYIYLIYS